MTLGRLMELYAAEQQGKQIMLREYRCGFFESYERITEVKLTEYDLSYFIEEDPDATLFNYIFFIKDEEDKYGVKIIET